MATAMVADFDTISYRHGDQRLNSPVTRVMAHLFKLFFRRSHKLTILNTVLLVNGGVKVVGNASDIGEGLGGGQVREAVV